MHSHLFLTAVMDTGNFSPVTNVYWKKTATLGHLQAYSWPFPISYTFLCKKYVITCKKKIVLSIFVHKTSGLKTSFISSEMY